MEDSSELKTWLLNQKPNTQSTVVQIVPQAFSCIPLGARRSHRCEMVHLWATKLLTTLASVMPDRSAQSAFSLAFSGNCDFIEFIWCFDQGCKKQKKKRKKKRSKLWLMHEGGLKRCMGWFYQLYWKCVFNWLIMQSYAVVNYSF